jgi:hypothetical protein
MIGSLIYLCASTPGIMLSVGINPLRRILRYLVLYPTLELCYPKGSTFELVGYSNSNWVGVGKFFLDPTPLERDIPSS